MEKFIVTSLGILLGLFLAFIIGIAVGLIPAAIIWLAWKEIAVPLFHAPTLTFFQCWLATAVISVVFNCLCLRSK